MILVWVSVTRCIIPSVDPSICSHGYECGTGRTCVFEKPECYANLGTCEGKCQSTQETPPDGACACKDDADCNYPYEGCGNCQCYKRDVRTCQVDSDCGQGWLCTGTGAVRICELRKTCSTDNDCLPGNVCRELSCCNPNAGNCPSTGGCQIGAPCTTQQDCSACNLLCEQGSCQQLATDACQKKACQSDLDCSFCSGSCSFGTCRVQGQPSGCQTVSCVQDGDCQIHGYSGCFAGCCG